MARHAEEIGFDSIWIEDHLLFRHEGQPDQGVWEGWAIIAAIAAVTSRVEIGPLVSCMSFRNPAYLAKLADTIEEISGGRLILGVGAGWHEAEYRAFGYPFDHRVSRFEEGLRIVHGLLRHGQGRLRRPVSPGPRVRAPPPGAPARRPTDPDRVDRGTHAGAAGPVWRPVECVLHPHEEPSRGRGAAPGPGRRGMPQGGARPGDARPHGRRVRRHGTGAGGRRRRCLRTGPSSPWPGRPSAWRRSSGRTRARASVTCSSGSSRTRGRASTPSRPSSRCWTGRRAPSAGRAMAEPV